jgi:hypothetical protein
VNLIRRIDAGHGEFLLFALTPPRLETDFDRAQEIAEASYQQALTTATELIAYCRTLGMPFGINVESVSIRRVEIEASVRLAQELRTQLKS